MSDNNTNSLKPNSSRRVSKAVSLDQLPWDEVTFSTSCGYIEVGRSRVDVGTHFYWVLLGKFYWEDNRAAGSLYLDGNRWRLTDVYLAGRWEDPPGELLFYSFHEAVQGLLDLFTDEEEG